MQNGNISLWFYLIGLWSIIWKGIALWRAAQQEQKIWFLFILILNTMGILEIIYLFKFAKKRLTIAEIQTWTTLLKRPQK